MLQGIPHDQVNFYWQQVLPFIERALKESQGDYTSTDIYLALRERDMQLWVWVEKDQITSVLVTQILSYPEKNVCLLFLGAGDGIEYWKDDETVFSWARDNNCQEAEIVGRKGWGRALDGWKETATHFRRAL